MGPAMRTDLAVASWLRTKSGIVPPRGEGASSKPDAGDALQVNGGDDLVGVDVGRRSGTPTPVWVMNFPWCVSLFLPSEGTGVALPVIR